MPRRTPRDTRSLPRYSTDIAAEITISDFGNFQRIACQAQNLSLGGVGLNLSQPLAETTDLMVNLFLVEEGIEDATTPSLNIEARVVWSSPTDRGGHQAGLRFTRISPEQQQLLQHFLSRLS